MTVLHMLMLTIDAMAAFMGMLDLEFVGGVLKDFKLGFTVQKLLDYKLDGAVAVGWEYVQVV